VPLKRHGFAFGGIIEGMDLQKVKVTVKKLQNLSSLHKSGRLGDKEFLEKLSNLVGKSDVYPMLSQLTNVVCSCGMIVDCYGSEDHLEYGPLVENAHKTIEDFVKGEWKPIYDVLSFSYAYIVDGKAVKGVSGQARLENDRVVVECVDAEVARGVRAVCSEGVKGKYGLLNLGYLLPRCIGGCGLMGVQLGEVTGVKS
jgi:hypothetical protein